MRAQILEAQALAAPVLTRLPAAKAQLQAVTEQARAAQELRDPAQVPERVLVDHKVDLETEMIA